MFLLVFDNGSLILLAKIFENKAELGGKLAIRSRRIKQNKEDFNKKGQGY